MSDRIPLRWRLSQAEQRQLIRDALAQDPSLPDLRIARAIGCAASTVARVRAGEGVAPSVATVIGIFPERPRRQNDSCGTRSLR